MTLTRVDEELLIDMKAVSAVNLCDNSDEPRGIKATQFWVNFWIGMDGKFVSSGIKRNRSEAAKVMDRSAQ